MKTLTQVVLPIAALAGLVFGITYILNYSRTAPVVKNDDGQSALGHDALKFNVILGRKDPESPFLRHWRDSYELGEHGHFDFWFRNPNEQPVRIAFARPSCVCGDAEFGIVQPADWEEYVRTSALAGLTSSSAGAIIAAFNTAEFATKIKWAKLPIEGKDKDHTVPAASNGSPQIGILRLNWKGKEPLGPKTLTGDVVTQLPGARPSFTTLKANFNLFPPFEVYSEWKQGNTIKLGDLGPNTMRQCEVFVASRTRPAMAVQISAQGLGDNADFVAWSAPVRLKPMELAAFSRKNRLPGDLGSVYRIAMTVHERTEREHDGQKIMKQLDLGPFDFSLILSTEENKSLNVPVNAIVRGEVSLVGGESADRIDFGSTFSSSETRSVQVTIQSERANLDLEVETSACTPDYLQVKLASVASTGDAKRWVLGVTIPAGKLYGNLSNGFVVLKAKDAQGRRMRIPIKAATFDGGAPF